MTKGYQTNFSSLYSENKEYESNRLAKARKTLSIINDSLFRPTEDARVLEIGSFKGDISIHLAPHFKEYQAMDIDQEAVAEANLKDKPGNLHFSVGNAEDLKFRDNSFDVVICSHVYEHVPHPEKLMSEIYRVMKDDGICYFAGGNKLKIIEPHYRLPFLSWLPKPLAHLYLRLTGKGNYYYESLRTPMGIRRLAKDFKITSYSLKIIKEPARFHSLDMIKEGSLKQRIGIFVYKYLRLFFPTFIWILKKNKD